MRISDWSSDVCSSDLAGVPLRAYNGAILGTLCLIDREERAPLTATEIERLEDFAGIIMAEADLRRLGVERDDARRTLERALDFSGIATWRYVARTGPIPWRGPGPALLGAESPHAPPPAAALFCPVH